jgi:hypothetical protein
MRATRLCGASRRCCCDLSGGDARSGILPSGEPEKAGGDARYRKPGRVNIVLSRFPAPLPFLILPLIIRVLQIRAYELLCQYADFGDGYAVFGVASRYRLH